MLLKANATCNDNCHQTVTMTMKTIFFHNLIKSSCCVTSREASKNKGKGWEWGMNKHKRSSINWLTAENADSAIILILHLLGLIKAETSRLF
jgi:hypothetical protein